MFRRIFFSLLLLLWSIQIYAQETCDVEMLREEIASYANVLDSENAATTLQDLATFALDSVAGCRSPLIFDSGEIGTTTRIDSITLDDGYWLVSLYTQGQFISALDVDKGNCRSSSGGIFAVVNDYRENAAETLLIAENGCEFSLTVNWAENDWRLEISPLSLGNPEIISVYSSEEIGLQPVIGAVEIPEGFYSVTLVAGSGIWSDFEIVDGSCEVVGSNPTQLFMTDTATAGEEVLLNSDGCTVFIFVLNALQNWTMEFDPLE